MLYVTSRNNQETFTAHRAARELRGPDGGMYVPRRIVPFSREELEDLGNIPFNDCLASMVNRLFGTRFSGWDMDFGVGRHPVRLEGLSNRILCAECWHNPQWDIQGMIQSLGKMILGEELPQPCAGGWLEVGIKLSVLTAVFAQLLNQGFLELTGKVDISLVSGDLSSTASAWIGRAMGLPIENIVVCCNENSSLWDLFYHGQFRTDMVSRPTDTPAADITQPQWLEGLIALACGQREALSFLEASRRGASYFPGETVFDSLRAGMQVSVVSGRRMKETIPNVYTTSAYLLSPYSALSYSGLLDYRARTGESRPALLFSERSPRRDLDTVATALSISREELTDYLNKQ